ncbi:MAG TPA: hypothetical protein VFL91_02580 [Thermomicrobiales bacterium]|nr:hypothetical protein [Thermomicrobiales bacterium]
MPDLDQTLKRLAVTFNARDIMTPAETLTCALDEVDARGKLGDHPNFDRIPIWNGNELTGYLERGTDGVKLITTSDLVSDGTSVIELVDILQERSFCFVLRERRISGYIHFSDLNNSLVKLSFYIMLETLERHLTSEIASRVDEENLEEVLDKKRARELIGYLKKQRVNHADFNLFSVFQFRDVLQCACRSKVLRMSDEDLALLADIRNLTAHASRPFVERHDDVKRLSRAKELCTEVLRIGSFASQS